ncbi:unnamed protein product, partial [Amoebophrya sp. A120]
GTTTTSAFLPIQDCVHLCGTKSSFLERLLETEKEETKREFQKFQLAKKFSRVAEIWLLGHLDMEQFEDSSDQEASDDNDSDSDDSENQSEHSSGDNGGRCNSDNDDDSDGSSG